MKYVYASLVVIVCVLIVLNIDKLKTAKPKDTSRFALSSCQRTNVSTGEQVVTGIAGFVSQFFGYFGTYGQVANQFLGSALANQQAPDICKETLNEVYIDKRTDFTYEKVVVAIIGILLIILIFKK